MPELLAPAGNLEKLKIAVLYGANAVYVAGYSFSLRGAADNFSNEELHEGIAFAHAHGAKVYVTLNAFLYDDDLKDLPAYVLFLEQCHTDAVIVSDVGVIDVVQSHSNLPVHLSTQASCLNQYAAQLWKNLGVRRLVLGREVSIQQARAIKQHVDLEIEMFVHGAMCMAYAGNCTISNYTAGRDSNRGGCVQSCRFAYGLQKELPPITSDAELISFMSSKDLRGLNLIPQFIEAEIDSLKIEGRMKSNLYVATTVSTYSQALQASRSLSKEALSSKLDELSRELEKIKYRGYTEASLQHPASTDSIYLGDRQGVETQYDIAGTVLEVHPEDFITLLTQNPFSSQSTVEILGLQGEIIALPVTSMRNLKHEPITHAPQNSVVLIPYVESVEPLTLARLKSVDRASV
ncbi:U32 family peptidase C-terminal domain-containing protein [Deltaproteobacteria bacterium TL4]